MYRLNLISDSINELSLDFISFSFNPGGFLLKILFVVLTIWIFLLFYGIGRITERMLSRKTSRKPLGLFIKFTLGYVVISTSIFLLGITSILTTINVLGLLIILSAVVLVDLKFFSIALPNIKHLLRYDFLKFLGLCFLLIGLLRLLPPQAAGDPLDYHLRFPKIYLFEKTIMIPSLGDESYATIPQLPEMLYITSQILSNGEISRYIHFGFFVLIYFLLFNLKFWNIASTKIGPFAALLFVSAPLILEIGTSAFSDLPALLCLLLSGFILITSKLSKKDIILAGIFMGGALASKIWILYYLPFYIILFSLLIGKNNPKKLAKSLAVFAFSALLIVLPWYIRSYIMSGDPFYVNSQLGRKDATTSIIDLVLKNFTYPYFVNRLSFGFDYGFLYLIGIFVGILNFKRILTFARKPYFVLLLILVISSLVVPIPLFAGRYALPYVVVIFTFSAMGFAILYEKLVGKIIVGVLFLVIGVYYLLNTLIILPYGLGWADSENYLKRNLIKDVRSYYDFNNTFTKAIKDKELLATYGMSEFYYANFRYKNIYYFYNQNNHILLIPTNEIHKLLIRGGDFGWFCNIEGIVNCKDYKIKLITFDSVAKLYLYDIDYKYDE